MNEYEVLTNIYTAIGNLLLSPNEYVKRRSVEQGALEIILETNELSNYLRIKRICN